MGLVPGPIGEAANLVSGLDSLSEGDYVGAAPSGLGEFPLLGEAATAAKIARAARRAQRLIEEARAVPRVEKISMGALRNAGCRDAHHIIQDRTVRDLPGYNTRAAPGIQLRGPASDVTSPHGLTRSVQRQPGSGTYGAERRIGYKTLRRAGISRAEARVHIRNADDYFRGIGVNTGTRTWRPIDRR